MKHWHRETITGISDSPRLFHNANLPSETAENRVVCLWFNINFMCTDSTKAEVYKTSSSVLDSGYSVFWAIRLEYVCWLESTMPFLADCSPITLIQQNSAMVAVASPSLDWSNWWFRNELKVEVIRWHYEKETWSLVSAGVSLMMVSVGRRVDCDSSSILENMETLLKVFGHC